MNLMGLQGGQYQPLSAQQIDTLHNAALIILEKTGITYESGLEKTVDMLEKNGAAVNREKNRIMFPEDLVTTSVQKAPKEVVLCGQNPENDLHLTEDRVHLGTGGAAIKILDPDTGDVRATTLDDLHKVSCLVDQLSNIHFLVRPCIPTDIDEKDYDINMFYACLSASGKHVMSGVNNEDGLHQVIEMAAMIAGGREKLAERPIISVFPWPCPRPPWPGPPLL